MKIYQMIVGKNQAGYCELFSDIANEATKSKLRELCKFTAEETNGNEVNEAESRSVVRYGHLNDTLYYLLFCSIVFDCKYDKRPVRLFHIYVFDESHTEELFSDEALPFLTGLRHLSSYTEYYRCGGRIEPIESFRELYDTRICFRDPDESLVLCFLRSIFNTVDTQLDITADVRQQAYCLETLSGLLRILPSGLRSEVGFNSNAGSLKETDRGTKIVFWKGDGDISGPAVNHMFYPRQKEDEVDGAVERRVKAFLNMNRDTCEQCGRITLTEFCEMLDLDAGKGSNTKRESHKNRRGGGRVIRTKECPAEVKTAKIKNMPCVCTALLLIVLIGLAVYIVDGKIAAGRLFLTIQDVKDVLSYAVGVLTGLVVMMRKHKE